MSIQERFAEVFGVWEEALPYLSIMFELPEMRLVVAKGGVPVTATEAAALLRISHAEASDLLRKAYSRCVLNRSAVDGAATYSAAEFGERLDHFAKYEQWDHIPPDVRRRINRRFLDEFIAKHRANVGRKLRGLEAANALPNDTVMLLPEIEEMIEAATDIVVQPCDCRRLGQNCDLPVETCIWLDSGALETLNRGHGRRLTHEEAKELVRWADRKGLMHTADSDWRTRGLHAICNCCSCDCYPFRAAQELGSQRVWPRSRYIAVHDSARCNLCGACVARCHFEAFYYDGTVVRKGGKKREHIVLDPERCWGCGLCANTCPEGAITMERWP